MVLLITITHTPGENWGFSPSPWFDSNLNPTFMMANLTASIVSAVSSALSEARASFTIRPHPNLNSNTDFDFSLNSLFSRLSILNTFRMTWPASFFHPNDNCRLMFPRSRTHHVPRCATFFSFKLLPWSLGRYHTAPAVSLQDGEECGESKTVHNCQKWT